MSGRSLKGTWDDPAIQTDPRTDSTNPAIRAAAEFLHRNESMHLHNYLESPICPYCALRATRAVAVFQRESAVTGGRWARNGAEMIAAERRRQVDVEGWTPEHDAEHDGGELLAAADCYLAAVQGENSSPCYDADDYVEAHWPWGDAWWKPSDDPIRNLVKAGALIAAEIDRLAAGESAVTGEAT